MKKKILIDELSWEELKTHIKNLEKRICNAIKSFLSAKDKVKETYLTRKDVCEMLKIDLGTLRNWTKRGKLHKLKIGNRVYYKLSQIDQALIPVK
jgi:excisionase family DNA binding protein